MTTVDFSTVSKSFQDTGAPLLVILLMVAFYLSSEGYVIYMGADKYENEDLIKYGLPEDMWFHVDDMSSAHVYLRLKKNQRLEDVSPATIMECAQLVKANSIEGCKMREVKVSKYQPLPP
jgi:predicted ribosome quality control (RQC) complex YloA/Tae2 family protein